MSNHTNKQRYWKSVFRRVISRWDEARSVDGTLGAIDYSRKLENPGGQFCPKVVRPSQTDFIADVELAARAALKGDKLERAFWDVVYVIKRPRSKVGYTAKNGEFAVMSDEQYHELKNSIQIKVGRMLVERGIHPVEGYFKPKDLR